MDRFIPIAKPLIGDDEIDLVIKVLKSGRLAQGPMVKEFEERFAEYIGVDYAIAVSNGTCALDLMLKAYGIKAGDEVITTPFTFIASTNAILYQGARPVFVDIDLETYNIDPDKVLEAITPRTKAILVVHLYGHPAEMKALKEIELGVGGEYQLTDGIQKLIDWGCTVYGVLLRESELRLDIGTPQTYWEAVKCSYEYFFGGCEKLRVI